MGGVIFPVEELLLALHLAYWQVTHWVAVDPGAIAFFDLENLLAI